MSISKYVYRLKRMDNLIRLKATGTPEQFSEKLSISRSVLFQNIKELKELGAPIEYDKMRETYFYKKHGKFSFEFTSS